MHWDVKSVKALPGYRLWVELENGRKGVFNLQPYLDRGVLRELRDTHYFEQVAILFGAITWPNGQDISPETLLAGMDPDPSGPPNGKCREEGDSRGGVPDPIGFPCHYQSVCSFIMIDHTGLTARIMRVENERRRLAGGSGARRRCWQQWPTRDCS